MIRRKLSFQISNFNFVGVNLKKGSIAFAIWFNWNHFKFNSKAIPTSTIEMHHISLVLQKHFTHMITWFTKYQTLANASWPNLNTFGVWIWIHFSNQLQLTCGNLNIGHLTTLPCYVLHIECALYYLDCALLPVLRCLHLLGRVDLGDELNFTAED